MHLRCASAPQFFDHVLDDCAAQGSSPSSEIFFLFLFALFFLAFYFSFNSQFNILQHSWRSYQI